MNDQHLDGDNDSNHSIGKLFEDVCDRFEAACKMGKAPEVSDCLVGWSDPERSRLEQELLLLASAYRQENGSAADSDSSKLNIKSAEDSACDIPRRVGRYRIDKMLGEGGFGRVFLGYDEKIERPVAIKVPHAHLVSNATASGMYLAEAQSVARLDHPNIVPVYDVGQTEDCPCFIVSKYVDGATLEATLKSGHFQYAHAAQLVATIASALHYAHAQRVVHRDIKPGNIILDEMHRPHIVDFGLALKESDLGKGPQFVGTPSYMSPEQAGGEGHRVDGRSDIYSLGVVLYELLLGQRPFSAKSQSDLLRQVVSANPPAPREINKSIPRQLEWICLKALSKRVSDRYEIAQQFADDLSDFVREEQGKGDGEILLRESSGIVNEESRLSSRLSTRNELMTMVPKGLRSFDEHDSDFFLELLPGPRARNGLPESIRFWKTRIEEPEADKTFSVGMIYGPTGCGKSSLVKAGLLPRLAPHIATVYVEATAFDTESRLVKGLRRKCPGLPADATAREMINAIRQGVGRSVGGKVLIVLDQFEQWLHSTSTDESELMQALRQCDGGAVQCIIMVRDDFWMAATRFMRDLEIQLKEGENSVGFDLFPVLHAERVLRAYGRALGAIPDGQHQLPPEQNEFIKQAIAGLAQDGRVICVQIALLAEMLKDKPWTPETLIRSGGSEGIGVAFLEETLCASTAPPQNRRNQQEARAVLEALLPLPGADIKGHLRTSEELRILSGCSDNFDFRGLLHTLDHELRLITPSDPTQPNEVIDNSQAGENDHPKACQNQQDANSTTIRRGERSYQLTHDYLVPSLRDWLTRKRRESRKGRAELLLAERSALWQERPTNRNLPSISEYLMIVAFTAKQQWTDTQRHLMRKTGRRNLTRIAAISMAVFIGISLTYALVHRAQALTLFNRLGDVQADNVLGVVEQLKPYERWVQTELKRQVAQTPQTPQERKRQLHARLAVVSKDKRQIPELLTALLDDKTSIPYVRAITETLEPYQSQLNEKLWDALTNTTMSRERRFHAALALAKYDPNSDRWTEGLKSMVAEALVSANPDHQRAAQRMLFPFKAKLIDELKRLFHKPDFPEGQAGAANALVAFAGNDALFLAELMAEATPIQFGILYPLVANSPDTRCLNSYRDLVASRPTVSYEEISDTQSIKLGVRRATAAITLLRQGEREGIFDVFRITNSPQSLTEFVGRCRQRGVVPNELLDCLDVVKMLESKDNQPVDPKIIYGLLLAIGEYSLDELPSAEQEPFIKQLLHWYENHPSSAVHAASGWLLRHWNRGEAARHVDQQARPYSADREWFILDVAASSDPMAKHFYFTFVVIKAGEYPLRAILGDLPDGREILMKPEGGSRTVKAAFVHPVRVPHSFAIMDREVTFAELEACGITGFRNPKWSKGIEERAAVGPSWYEAVKFCRWITERRKLNDAQQAYPDQATLDSSLRNGEYPEDWPVNLQSMGCRLPTVVELEAAARAGSHATYSYGAVRDDRYGVERRDPPAIPRTSRPNLYGIFDAEAGCGNVVEWCHDRLPLAAAQALSTRQGQHDRGAKDVDPPLYRILDRNFAWRNPSEGNNNVGFRVVYTLP